MSAFPEIVVAWRGQIVRRHVAKELRHVSASRSAIPEADHAVAGDVVCFRPEMGKEGAESREFELGTQVSIQPIGGIAE